MKRTLGFLLISVLALPALAEQKKSGVQVTTGGRTYNIGSVTGPAYQHEVMLNGSNQIIPLSNGTAGTMAFGSSTIISFGGGYAYHIIPDLSVGGAFSVAHSGGTIFSFMAGPTYNLIYNGNVQDSFFLSGELGLIGVGGVNGFAFRFDAGKRFEIFEHFTWRPSLGVLFIGNNLGTRFVINLLAASLQF